MVKDKKTREMYPAEAEVMQTLGANAKKHGLVLRLIGNRIAFSPPLIITEAEVSEMASRLKLALDDTWTSVRGNRCRDSDSSRSIALSCAPVFHIWDRYRLAHRGENYILCKQKYCVARKALAQSKELRGRPLQTLPYGSAQRGTVPTVHTQVRL